MNSLRISIFAIISFIAFSPKLISSQSSLIISAIPDQNPEKLNRLYKTLSKELSEELGVPVKYMPVINYTAAVTAFRTGHLHLVWFGGLTGVQARLQRPGANVIAQRLEDSRFRSVFIANTSTGIKKLRSNDDLKILKGKRFTFGSEVSTSGRLMPQYFLQKAGMKIKDFAGGIAGFSGSHDVTIALVESGAYEAGALNELVWESNVKEERVDRSKVKVIWRTPTYADYHWLAQPNLNEEFGDGFTNKLKNALLSLNRKNPRDKVILDLFGATKFIPAKQKDYDNIEDIGRKLGKI